MILQLIGDRFPGQFVYSIGPTLVILTADTSQALRFNSVRAAMEAWPGDWRDVEVIAA